MALMASTVFFLWETQRDGNGNIASIGLVTFIRRSLFLHAGCLITTGETPTVYRYIDWLLPFTLMIEFFLILRAIGNASGGISGASSLVPHNASTWLHG